MIIIRDKQTKRVKYADCTLLADHVQGDGFVDYTTNESNAEILTVDDPPYPVPAAYTYDNGWIVADADAIAAYLHTFGAQRMLDCEDALENMLDTKARERTWKDCMSARAAAGYPSSFQPEGIAFVNWWAACWELAHTILAEVQASTRPIPTVEEFLAEMPELVLP